MSNIAALERRLAREVAARKAAEQILENKSLELFKANQKLQNLNTSLETEVEKRSLELFESEKRFKVLVEGAYDLIYVVDPEGFITYINHVIYTEGGYKTDEVIGTHFSLYIHEDYILKVMEEYYALIQEKAPSAYNEVKSLRKNGKEIWLGQNVQFTYNANGTLKEVIVIARDITDKKKEEELLISTQLQLLSLIENMHEGVLFHSTEGEILLINSFFCDFFGFTILPEDIKGKHLNEIQPIFESHINNFHKKLKETLKEPSEQKIGLEIRLLDNRFIKYDYIPIVANEKVIGTLWQFTDITAQKLLDLQIRNSEEKYRSIIENMELGLLEVDNDGNILKVYEWFCKMTGYTETELIGKNAEDLLLPEEYKSVIDENHGKRRDGEQSVYEIEIFKKNRERIWVIISGAPFFDLAGRVIGSIGIHFDITRQKKLQNDLIAAKEIAEKAQIAEQKFLASMSHEIRTPLNAVIGMSHLLNDTPLNSEQREYIDMMQYSANLLRKLVTDVLDFAKIESGTMEVNSTPFDLTGLLKTLHKTFELKLSGKPVSVKVILPTVDYLLVGDETLLNQVLYNLLGNAEKFTSTGEIRLSAKLKEHKGNKVSVLFEVRDTGIGIDEAKQKDIFKEFKQESRETSVKYGGTGLGLSITKRIIEALDGSIWLKSKKGKGTSFFVELPLMLSKNNTAISNTHRNEQLSESSRVLIFEDNIVNQNYIKKILLKEKIEFDIANNGKEGLAIAKAKTFDLIFMDISMPIMDGYEATIAIRNNLGPNQNTPIIALTASAMLNKKDKAFLIGMDHYMTKPFTPQELKSTLAKYLNPKRENKGQTRVSFITGESVLNIETLNMFYDGDKQYALEMFELFMDQYEEQIEFLRASLKSKSYADAQKVVHKMKPTFSMVGAPEMQRFFQLLEDKLRYNDEIGIDNYWQKSEALLQKYIPAIRDYLNHLKTDF